MELRARLAAAIRDRRASSKLTQREVAGRLGTSQPRVAKIEAASPDVSLDLIVRCLFAVGGRLEDLIGRPRCLPRKPAKLGEGAGGPGVARK